MWKMKSLGWLKNLDPQTRRRLGLNAGKTGFIVAIALFVFQVTQSWCDKGIDALVLRWIFPTLAAVSVSLILGGIFHVIGLEKYIAERVKAKTVSTPPEEMLAQSIVQYGMKLRAEGRDKALTTLRNNFSNTLHVLGFHDSRVQLGGIALESAVIIGDLATRAEILIDDLGWAHFLKGNLIDARKNIERGIELAKEARVSASETQATRVALCQAKGLRHLALMDATSDVKAFKERIDEATDILKVLDQSNAEVKREIAQVHHAVALSTAMRLGIHKSGSIRAADADGLAKVDEALQQVRRSEAGFKEISDRERYAKALALEVRLLEAKQSEVEAKEVAAVRDRTLSESEWIRPEGKMTLTGV